MTVYEKIDEIMQLGKTNYSGENTAILRKHPKNFEKLDALFADLQNVTEGEHVQGTQKLGYIDNMAFRLVYIDSTDSVRLEKYVIGDRDVNGINIDKFVKDMENFDHYYQYSDDHRVWRAGSAGHGKLIFSAEALAFLPTKVKYEAMKPYFGKKVYAEYINRMLTKKEIEECQAK